MHTSRSLKVSHSARNLRSRTREHKSSHVWCREYIAGIDFYIGSGLFIFYEAFVSFCGTGCVSTRYQMHVDSWFMTWDWTLHGTRGRF